MKKYLLMLSLTAALCASASAGVVVSATGAIIDSGGPGFGAIENTFNQAGLATGYTSGVTDFDTYIASNPLHDVDFNLEWFSNEFTATAIVTYDLGAVRTISALALWNEELSGIGALQLFGSSDGVNFTLLLGNLTPVNNPLDAPYGPEVFEFAPTDLRYIRLDMSACPQSPAFFLACAVGEVAFEAVPASGQVPEPDSIALLAAGIGGAAFVRRRARAAVRA